MNAGEAVAKGGRIGLAAALTIVAAAAAMWAFMNLMTQPSTVAYAASAGQVNVVMQTVGSYGKGDHPTWVSYLTKDAAGAWQHTTIWSVPAHTRVNVTIFQYDSGSPLRNQQIGQVTGTIGDTASLNGKPFKVYNSNSTDGVGHTFSIPTLGISVPLTGNDPNATLCAVAPCTTNFPHNVVTFSFMSPGPGDYPWQCFVPCGLGWLYGNGGPMGTVGYMGGFMRVSA